MAEISPETWAEIRERLAREKIVDRINRELDWMVCDGHQTREWEEEYSWALEEADYRLEMQLADEAEREREIEAARNQSYKCTGYCYFCDNPCSISD